METLCFKKNNATIRYISDVPLKEFYLKNKDNLEFFDAKIIENNEEIFHTIYYYDRKNEESVIIPYLSLFEEKNYASLYL